MEIKTGVTYCYIQVSESNKETEAPVSRWAETSLQTQRKTDRKWFDKGGEAGITCGSFISLKLRKNKGSGKSGKSDKYSKIWGKKIIASLKKKSYKGNTSFKSTFLLKRAFLLT